MSPRLMSRRSALTLAATAGASLGTSTAFSSDRPRYRRTSRSAVEKIEVGIIGTGGFGHAFPWATSMNPPLEEVRGGYLPRMTGMAATMCWDPDPELAAEYANRFGLKVVKNYDDMLGKVDAVVTTDYIIMEWQPRLIEPYLKAGMPVLVQRPMALSFADARRITELSRKYNAPIHVPSAFETRHETMLMQEQLKKLKSNGAVITGAIVNHRTSDYPAHATHGIYRLFRVLEPDVRSVKFVSDSWWSFKEGFMKWQVVQKDGPDYELTLLFKHDYRTIIQTTGGIIDENIRLIGDGELDPYSRYKWHNYLTLQEFAEVVESGKMVESYDHILAKNKTLFAGWYSHLEKNGDYVDLATYPEEWRAPGAIPTHVPERIRQPDRFKAAQKVMQSIFP